MKYLLAVFFSVLAMSVIAQQQPFVEIIVEDTLHIAPDEIIYTVSYVDEDDYDIDTVITVSTTTDRVMHEKTEMVPAAFHEVRMVINEMRLDTLTENNYTIANHRTYGSKQSIRIRFPSLAMLNQFTRRIKNLKNIVGAISSVKSFHEDAGMKELFKRLMVKARKEAESLAQLAGKKLGSLYSAQEQQVLGGWTSYPPLSDIPGWHTTLSSTDETIKLQRRFAVRFHWN
jgi:hypothetical protein